MNCHSSNLEQFIDLGYQPNGNVFPTADELTQEKMFPCVMLVCTQCWQVQLEAFPAVDTMFTNHPYITGLNQPVVTHFEQLVQDILQKFAFKPNSLVLDIGANDGTLLLKFRERGMRVLGIDPCKRTNQLAQENGIISLDTFWNKENALAIQQLGLYPDLITATAVFYHIEDIHSFIQGLAMIMKENTIFCTQCVYLKDIIEKGQFDHFYHEHTLIHAITPLKRLFSQYGMRLLDVDFYSVHGGVFVLYVAKENAPYPTTEKIQQAIAEEKRISLDQLQTYTDFAKRVEENKISLVLLLKKIRNEDKQVFGMGAPLKGSTLLNYCHIDSELVQCLVEINPYKIGRYSPNTHIPIVSEDMLHEPPDYYLILSWNFLDFFIDKYADYLNNGGKFIVPHPTVRIIGKNGKTEQFDMV